MAMRATPPRLHVLFARKADTALVVARVRSLLFCTIGWDRTRDTFEVGQWLRARIYPFRSDLSPDGTQFVYFAFDGRRISRGESEAYTAVSRAPYLKALQFWPQDETYHGGGLFLDDRTLWANGSYEEDARQPPGLRIVGAPPELPFLGYEDRRVYFPRLLRDGWSLARNLELSPKHDVHVFEKPLRHGFVLEKAFHGTSERQRVDRGCYYEEYALLAPSGGREERPNWEWADLDAARARIVYAREGCLYAAPLGPEGTGAATTLFDARSLTFTAIQAPY